MAEDFIADPDALIALASRVRTHAEPLAQISLGLGDHEQVTLGDFHDAHHLSGQLRDHLHQVSREFAVVYQAFLTLADAAENAAKAYRVGDAEAARALAKINTDLDALTTTLTTAAHVGPSL